MNLRKLILTKNACYISGQKITPCGVMVHSTAANNPYIKRYVGPNDGVLGQNQYNNHWNTFHAGGKDIGRHDFVDNGKGVCKTCGGMKKCVHGFIGKVNDGSIATYQTLPFDMQGWHAGGSANTKGYIGFEICEDALTDRNYFNAVYKEAVEFTAYLCNMYKLDPMKDGVVICHKEGNRRGIASNHSDVEHWFPKFGKTMDDFRKEVKAAMGGTVTTTAAPAPQPRSAVPNDGYRVQITISNLNIRKGPGTNFASIGFIKPGVYTIVEESPGPGANLWGKLKSGQGYVALDHCKKL